jgi:hypothetical protein
MSDCTIDTTIYGRYATISIRGKSVTFKFHGSSERYRGEVSASGGIYSMRDENSEEEEGADLSQQIVSEVEDIVRQNAEDDKAIDAEKPAERADEWEP